jgi:hypothetical protein
MYVWVSQTPSLFEYLPHFTLLGIPLIIGFFLVVFKYFLEKNAIYVALISILLAGVLVWALGRVVTDIQATVEQNMSNITLALLAVIVFLTLMGKEAIRALLLLCIILTMALVFSNKLTTVDKKTQFALWGTVILMLVIAYFIKPASATPLITPVSPPVSAETGRLSKLGADLKRWGKKFGDNFK